LRSHALDAQEAALEPAASQIAVLGVAHRMGSGTGNRGDCRHVRCAGLLPQAAPLVRKLAALDHYPGGMAPLALAARHAALEGLAGNAPGARRPAPPEPAAAASREDPTARVARSANTRQGTQRRPVRTAQQI